MKQVDIKNLSTDDLREQLAESSELISKLKMSHAVSPLENPKQITVARKTIARLNTEIRKRELQEAK
ncbi:50S ribosomal protein L29 [Vicingaceae bacterium]|jgi:large subunit ribosomal protein L29|nr:50S ribosomal protein L29 [Vicingaceae bacterium]